MRYTTMTMTAALLGSLLAGPAFAGDIEGRIFNDQNQPIPDANIRVRDTDFSAKSDARGHFHIEDMPAGDYELVVMHGGGMTVEPVTVPETGQVEMQVLFRITLAEMFIQSSAFDDQSVLNMSQPVQLLSGDALEKLKAASLGETLANQLGVSATYFGPASGRPVLRGLTGNRVRVQQDGISSLDVSALSPDHAVAIEPLLIDAVEIVKGPATLLYGNGAFGGVVNVEDSRIPDESPGTPLTGAVELRGDTAANEKTFVLRLDGGKDDFAWHADAFSRRTDDVEIPSNAESLALRQQEADESGEPLETDPGSGFLENTDMESSGGAFGASWLGEKGFFGAAISTYNSNYGVPGHAHEETSGGEPESVRIDMEQTRYDIKARRDAPFSGIESVKFRFGYNDYQHVELEGGAVGTTFTNQEFDARLEAVHSAIGAWRGAFGLQVHDRDFEAIGDEAYVPPTRADGFGVFLVEERESEQGRFEIGGRFERQSQDTDTGMSTSDNAFSFSSGYVHHLDSEHNIGINLSRAERLPDIEERYAEGAHLATRQYEIGNPDLDKETANNIDLTFKRHAGLFHWTVNLYYNKVADFIYLQNQGTVIDELPVAMYTQADATLKGYEAEIESPIWKGNDGSLTLRVFTDFTRGTLDGGGNLPRIPPRRIGSGIEYKTAAWTTELKATHHARQDETATLETPSNSYLMVDANFSYDIRTAHSDYRIFARAGNLLDEEARRHSSFLKDLAPLPGRNFTLGVQANF